MGFHQRELGRRNGLRVHQIVPTVRLTALTTWRRNLPRNRAHLTRKPEKILDRHGLNQNLVRLERFSSAAL